jgi:putative aldouronate transport system permease protein
MGIFAKNLNKNKIFLLMVLPVTIWFVLFSYIPMLGNVLAFKQFRIHRDGFIASVIHSKWIGFENFKFLFNSEDAFLITRNTVVYNFFFIFLGLLFSLFFAIVLNELKNKRLVKIYQTGILLPYFISMVVVSYFGLAFLSMDKGLLNYFLAMFGKDPIQWYNTPEYWPYILTLINLWKGTGIFSVIYFAAIIRIDKTYFEAAMIDGATKLQQIIHITLPFLIPLITILTLLNIGRIFFSDFGLFYQVPFQSGPLFPVTQVIDTYVFRSLRGTGNIGMSTAAGLYQSLVGFILIISANYIVKKTNKENAIY